MPTLTRERIRLALDLATKTTVKDKLTGTNPDFWRGVDVSIELAIFHNGTLLDITNFSSLRLLIRPGDNRLGAAVIDKTLNAAALNTSLTLTAWNNNTAQHAQFTLTNLETDIAIGANEQEYWLVAIATLTTGEKLTCGAAKLNILEDGA